MNTHVITGGLGFLGAGLVKQLVPKGVHCHVLDDGSRGNQRRLNGVPHFFQECDVRKPFAIPRGTKTFWHLAARNGTANFYKDPWEVLTTQVQGTMHALEACRQAGCTDFVLYSSSEAYQTPPKIPTPEDVPLVVPDPANPRYSYGGGKITAELLVRHCPWLTNVTIIRPHNVYGPDMGYDHVIPEFIMRARRLQGPSQQDYVGDDQGGALRPYYTVVPTFEIRSGGADVRSFIYETDFTFGVVKAWESHNQGKATFNVGTEDMVTMGDLAKQVVAQVRGERFAVRWTQTAPPVGSTRKRCPDMKKLRDLGGPWCPSPLSVGLSSTVRWYLEHQEEWPV